MGTNDLLVGTLLIGATTIKTIVSMLKMVFEIKSPKVIKCITLGLGVVCGFVLETSLFEIANQPAIAVIAQRIFSGMVIAASAMGVHEISKKVK